MWQKLTVGFLISTGLIVGCDKESESGSSPATQPTPAPLAAVPTTQQLLTGPRTKLDLKFAPFTLNVPQSWELKTFNDGATVILEGSTPTDTVGISIPVYRTITADQEKALETHAKQDAIEHSDLIKSNPIRDMPGTKVIEQLILDAPTSATTQPLQTLQWIYTLCIPNGKDFTAYDLRIIGLTTQQYKNDQAFLRSIIDTATYIPSPADPTVK